RAKELSEKGKNLHTSNSLSYFLNNNIGLENFTDETLNIFASLDNYDIVAAIKSWTNHNDYVLATLSKSLINRKLPKVILQNSPFTNQFIDKQKELWLKKHPNKELELNYFIFDGHVSNQAYEVGKESIKILYKNGTLKDLASASDQFNIQALSNKVFKYYLCFPKNR
ncbi:MAG: HD domain-containing protein, partial [Lutibacter sp.]